MAHVPLPIMPQREQVNGGGPKPVSPVFLGEQRTIATRLSGSSNMAPALHHMGWLASLCVFKCVGVCVCMCVCGGVWWMPALMQMLAVLKNGSLSLLLCLSSLERSITAFWCWQLFFSSPEGRRAREMHLSSILKFDIIDLVTGKGIYEVMYFSAWILIDLCLKNVHFLCLIYEHANLVFTAQQYKHTHTDTHTYTHQSPLQHPSMPSVSAPL